MILPLLEFRHIQNYLYTAVVNVVNLLTSGAFRVHVSAPYSKIEITTAL